MDYVMRDIDTELWSKVKTKATLERKTMHEVIFENLKWHITQVETTSGSDKKKKGKKEGGLGNCLISQIAHCFHLNQINEIDIYKILGSKICISVSRGANGSFELLFG